MRAKVMVVDDEIGILKLIKDYLVFNEYEVITARSGIQALEKLSEKPDLILLDINMPVMNGFEVCKQIRIKADCPIIFLTARAELDDLVAGLNVGADDYITKPFNIIELGARIGAHLRREEIHNIKAKKSSNGLIINYGAMTASYSGKSISFTKTEFEIIELLSTNPGQIFDRERIYEIIKGYDATGDNTVITEHIRKIRTKFIEAGCEPKISTVWGVGYKWEI